MDLFIEEIGHFVAYLLAVFVVYLVEPAYVTRRNFVVGLLMTYAMDADHLIDYAFARGFDILSMNLKGFFSGYYFDYNQKVYVFFHAWEYVAALLLCYFGFIKDKLKHSWLFFVALAMFAHIVFDILSNGFTPLVYSILYRVQNGFDIKVFDN